MSNTGQAWVTLATNDSYALGALVLAQSLKRNNTIHQLAILITPGVSSSMREVLSSTFDVVKEVDVLDSKDAANLALMARPDLGITFTKLHCWNLTQYTKCVFLDADTLVIKNCDELFERDELSAAPDAGWPDCFNSGVFVFTPSEDTFKALLDFALANGSFDGGDQGLLNMYFGDWATKDITKHLPFVYNMVATATYSYLPAFKAFGGNVKIAHFIGSSKPWLQALPSGTSLSSFLDAWWDIFLKDVSKKLNTNMIINCTVFEEGPQASKFSTPHPPTTTVHRHVFVDPWDYIQQKQPKQTDSYLNTEDVIDRLVEHLKQTQHHHQAESHYPTENRHHVSTPHNLQTYVKQHSAPDLSHDKENSFKEASQTYSNILKQQKTQSLQLLQQRPLQNHDGQLYTQKEDIREEPLRRVESYENIPSTISPPFTPSCVEQTSFLTKTEEPTAVTEEEGLAGALAGGQKDVIEDQWRKQSWEQGNIDYMGKDAFENIWKKISETVGEDIKPLEAPVPEVSTVQIEAESTPTPEVPKTEDKTDASTIATQQASEKPEETPQPKEDNQSEKELQPKAPKAEPTPETIATAEPIAPSEPDAPKEVIPAEAKKEEAPTAEASEPSAPPAEAGVAPEVASGVPLDVQVATAAETEPSVPTDVTSAIEQSIVQIQPVAPEPNADKPVPAAPTESAPKDPVPPADASQPASPPPLTTEVPSSPQLPEPELAIDPKTATAASSADQKGPSPPKDDSKPPEPPKDGGAEKVAIPVLEPAAPTSPSVPSPASPSAPEGTKVDDAQPPLSPEPLTPSAAETSTPPQTPIGDAPVPPKRSSKKGKAKK